MSVHHASKARRFHLRVASTQSEGNGAIRQAGRPEGRGEYEMMNDTFNLILFECLNPLSKFSKFPPPRPAPQISSPTERRDMQTDVRTGMAIAPFVSSRFREDANGSFPADESN
jgi:hypothetical protein